MVPPGQDGLRRYDDDAAVLIRDTVRTHILDDADQRAKRGHSLLVCEFLHLAQFNRPATGIAGHTRRNGPSASPRHETGCGSRARRF